MGCEICSHPPPGLTENTGSGYLACGTASFNINLRLLLQTHRGLIAGRSSLEL